MSDKDDADGICQPNTADFEARAESTFGGFLACSILQNDARWGWTEPKMARRPPAEFLKVGLRHRTVVLRTTKI